jgi:hypothetical protein
MSKVYSRAELTELLQAKLNRELSAAAAAAVFACYKWDGKTKCFRLRKTSPSRAKAPHAWAAWQGIHVARAGDGTIGGLLFSDEETRGIWDEVSDFALAVATGQKSGRIDQ